MIAMASIRKVVASGIVVFSLFGCGGVTTPTSEFDTAAQEELPQVVRERLHAERQAAVELYDFASTKLSQQVALLDDVVWKNLYKVWPASTRAPYESIVKQSGGDPLTSPELRKMVFARYGLVRSVHADDPVPMGFTVTRDRETGIGQWRANCLLCHGGLLYGEPTPGVANIQLDFQGLADDLIAAHNLLGKDLNPWLTAFSFAKRFGRKVSLSRGTAAAFTFSGGFVWLKNTDLEEGIPWWLIDRYAKSGIGFLPFQRSSLFYGVKDVDVDTPNWYGYKYYDRMHSDGDLPKTARALMTPVVEPGLTGDAIKARLPEFNAMFDKLNQLPNPVPYSQRFPSRFDSDKSGRGQVVFEANCARCHGHYANGIVRYEEKYVDASVINSETDRLEAITPAYREFLRDSWLGVGRKDFRTATKSYRAPALVGVAGTYPYFHNGSVPTLYHVLFPEKRPAIWRARNRAEMDHEHLGLAFEAFRTPPAENDPEAREYFVSSKYGKGNTGHEDIMGAIDEQDRLDLLEYLKTL